MKKIGFIVKKANPDAIELCMKLARYVMDKGIEPYADADVAAKTGFVKPADRDTLSNEMDALVVLGGDGTMLYASRLVGGKRIPILGVNMGGLGFLTAVKVEEAQENIDKMLEGKVEVEERMMLNVKIIRDKRKFAEYRVLNDAVIKGRKTRLVRMETRVDQKYMTTYRADGLIISTPTGSTAYALSAGGPILHPTLHSILVVPISPFNLSKRPIVLPESVEIEVKILTDNMEIELTLDGQVDMPINTGDVVVIKRAEESVWFVKSDEKNYFDVLRERLLWGR